MGGGALMGAAGQRRGGSYVWSWYVCLRGFSPVSTSGPKKTHVRLTGRSKVPMKVSEVVGNLSETRSATGTWTFFVFLHLKLKKHSFNRL